MTKKRSKTIFTTMVFAVLTAAGVAVSIEIGAFVTLCWARGSIVTYTDLRAALRRAGELVEAEEASAGAEWRQHRIQTMPALHPYIGYVADPSTHPLADDERTDPLSADYGFPQNRQSLFQTPSDDTVVVGVFGGSLADTIAAWSGALGSEFDKIDRFAGKKVVMLSLAYGGYKQPQQLMALAYLLSVGAHFDLVVNLDGFNEVTLPAVTNVPKDVFPFYPRGWLLQVADLDQELRRTAGLLTYLRGERAAVARRMAAGPWRYSMTAGLWWHLRDRRLVQHISAAELALLDRETSSRDYQGHGPRRGYASEQEMYRDLVEVWSRSSREMNALCAGLGIEYLHFLQPNQYVPDTKPLSAEERRLAWQPDHPYRQPVEKGYPLLVEAGRELRRQGVEFVDLTTLFAEHAETLYRDTCCHLNRRGNVQLARAMARAVDAAPARAAVSGLETDR